MKKRNRQPRSREALNSELIRRPIRRCWPLFLLPTALAFCIGFLYPFLLGLYRSFCEFTSPVDYHWAGFSNYFRAFADEGFRRAFGFTRLEHLPHGVLHAEPHRRHRAGLHLEAHF